jgi:hypothetical protein
MFDSDRAAFEKVLRGVPTEVESLIQKPGAAEFRGLAPEDLAFESEFSRLVTDVKSFCRDSSTPDPN